MKIEKTDKVLRRKLYRLEAIALTALYSLYCLVIFPLTLYVTDDVAFENTVLSEILSYLGSIAEISAIAVAYAVTVFGICKLDKENMQGSIAVFATATLYKYVAHTLVYWCVYGSIPKDWAWDLGNAVFYTALEIIQLLVVIAVINAVMKKCPPSYDSDGNLDYPVKNLYDKSNYLMRASLWCAVISVSAKVIGSFIDDVFMIISGGFPQKAVTWALMLISYFSNVIFGAVCYFVMLLVLMKLREKYGSR